MQGPEIIDELGRPVWFHAVTGGDQAADFRVQRYRGQPVLTWWQGQSHTGAGHGEGVDYIVDRSYRVIATVNAGNGLAADTHEFRLTPEGTALIVVYHAVPYDLSAVGGPAAGSVFDGIVQEIDIATGAVLFEWHSLDHVGLDESHAPVPAAATTTYDYFHINAVSVDEDGNLIVDARNTWAFYKVHRRSGRIIWRLGGTKSDFALGPDAAFAWQHNPEAVDRETVRLFDNEAAPVVLPHSRVIWLRRDPRNHTATLDPLVRAPRRSVGRLAGRRAGAGERQHLRRLGADRAVLRIRSVGQPALRRERAGRATTPIAPSATSGTRSPTARRSATAARNADGTTTVHAVWNGATEVARWIVVGGPHAHALRRAGRRELERPRHRHHPDHRRQPHRGRRRGRGRATGSTESARGPGRAELTRDSGRPPLGPPGCRGPRPLRRGGRARPTRRRSLDQPLLASSENPPINQRLLARENQSNNFSFRAPPARRATAQKSSRNSSFSRR